MTISLDSYDYGFGAGVLIHGDILAPDYSFDESIQTFWGLLGAAVLYSPQNTRIITLPVQFLNFATQALLTTHIATVRSHITDNGTLVVDGINWPLTAFVGYTPDGPTTFDSSGQHGWNQSGTLNFRQIKS
jgi:hypothetical protein